MVEKEPREPDADPDPATPELGARIKKIIETRVKPALMPGEGDVIYRGIKDGVVFVEMVGAGTRLRTGLEKILRRDFPEIAGVADYRAARPALGLETETGRAIRRILDERVNPSVAGHGGRISLVDVLDDTAYIRMEGSCRGCRMAGATLKQGVAKEIQARFPSIRRVLDVTDHDGGADPYHQPGKTRKNPLFR